MNIKRIHYISGLIITIFIGLHLFNHAYGIFGADKHIEIMNTLRLFYRNAFVEFILSCCVILQIFSGLKLFWLNRKTATTLFNRLHIWTGLYLAIFLVIHLGAVLAGRFYFHLDTNYYFGVAGLNSFPLNLFFIPYYALAIFSFFGHIAAIHNQKMKHTVFGLNPNQQSVSIIIFGMSLAVLIFYGLTNQFKGVDIPKEYNVLIGK
jgi:hypothetical protein